MKCQFCKNEYQCHRPECADGCQCLGCPECVRPLGIQYDDSEKTSRCRFCGYMVTDQEKAAYNQTFRNSKNEIVECFNYCVFCDHLKDKSLGMKNEPIGALTSILWKIFRRDECKIHELKIKIRETIYKSPLALRLVNRINDLSTNHYNDLHPTKYESDENGWPIKNQFQKEFERITEELADLLSIARLAYYNSLGKFGSSDDDTPPATRKLSAPQKASLVKALKHQLETLQSNRRRGDYE